MLTKQLDLTPDQVTQIKGIYADEGSQMKVLIDFRDVPALASFVLPDTSHIDGTDVPRFTDAMADLLKSRGLVGP